MHDPARPPAPLVARTARQRLAWLLAAAATGACASGGNAGPTPTEETPATTRREVLRNGTPGLVEYHPPANRARVIDLRASPDSLWPRVLGAYDRLGLPLGEVDTRQHTLGTSSVRAVGQLGGTRLGEYLDCGQAPLGTRAADSYIVVLRVTTELKTADTSRAPAVATPAVSSGAPYTTLRTLVEATAKANATQGDPVDCVSTGRLETRLVRLVAPPALARSR